MSRPGLRWRVTLLFAAGALLLSAALAFSTYQLTARHVLSERERTAVRAAYFDAAVVRQGLSGDDADVVGVLRSLDTGQSRRPLLHRGGQWFARSADDGLTSAIPSALQSLVEGEAPAVQRVVIAGQPALVVGVPLARNGEDFYEIQSLAEVQDTLRTLSATLAAVAVAATVAAAALSRWISGRALRPLQDVVEAATQIRKGDLTVRMRPSEDPDLRKLTQAFNTMVTEVSERINRDQRFAADVSHELRSPLQTLTAASSVLLRRSAHLDERSAAAARLVSEEAERFTTLVQGLLVLARAETRASLVTADVTALVSRACQRTGVPLDRVEVGPGVTTWPLDPARIEQSLVNLMDNGRNHGGGVVSVTIDLSEGRLVFTVDDGGPGVPVDERSVIFDRFGRGRAAHSRGEGDGSGLGLALVAQHAAAHGGHVEVLDRPGGGGRFQLTLPPEADR
jgi:two-component system sensor histidine kinase MtrB